MEVPGKLTAGHFSSSSRPVSPLCLPLISFFSGEIGTLDNK
jgi:hypothetical protein